MVKRIGDVARMAIGVQEIDALIVIRTVLHIRSYAAGAGSDEMLGGRPTIAAVGGSEDRRVVIRVATEVVDLAALARKLKRIGVSHTITAVRDGLFRRPVAG